MKRVLTPLMGLYVALLLDLFTGQSLNLYGWGREPLWFASGVVVLAVCFFMSGQRGRWLGMITLVLCCAWLALYPEHNGWDATLAPTLLIGIVFYTFKSRFNEN
jgi:hypothetical protein